MSRKRHKDTVRVLAISGSPRRHGNSEIILDAAILGAAFEGAATAKIIVNDLCLNPCQGCSRCYGAAGCFISDDIHVIYRRINEADGIIISSPVYFGSLPAQLKMMVDRFQPQWLLRDSPRKPINTRKKRSGIFLCVAGQNKAKFFRNSENVVRNLYALLGVEYLGHVFCGGVNDRGEINKEKTALKKAFDLGARLVRNVRLITPNIKKRP